MLPPGLRQLLRNLHGHVMVAVYWRRNAPGVQPFRSWGQERQEEKRTPATQRSSPNAPRPSHAWVCGSHRWSPSGCRRCSWLCNMPIAAAALADRNESQVGAVRGHWRWIRLWISLWILSASPVDVMATPSPTAIARRSGGRVTDNPWRRAFHVKRARSGTTHIGVLIPTLTNRVTGCFWFSSGR
jgi:hypothetical protein